MEPPLVWHRFAATGAPSGGSKLSSPDGGPVQEKQNRIKKDTILEYFGEEEGWAKHTVCGGFHLQPVRESPRIAGAESHTTGA